MASWAELYAPDEGTGAPTQVEPHPKPVKRHRASQKEWEEIRAGYANECCVYSGEREIELHHVVRRSQGGDDIAENLVPLSREAHTAYHSRGPKWPLVAAAVRQWVMSKNERRRYVEQKLGERFNDQYPPLPNTDPQFQSDFSRIYGIDNEGAI